MTGDFYKNEDTDVIYWVDDFIKGENGELSLNKGLYLFSFDKKKIYNLFEDYPDKLTAEELRIFNTENPYWADYFKDRLK